MTQVKHISRKVRHKGKRKTEILFYLKENLLTFDLKRQIFSINKHKNTWKKRSIQIKKKKLLSQISQKDLSEIFIKLKKHKKVKSALDLPEAELDRVDQQDHEINRAKVRINRTRICSQIDNTHIKKHHRLGCICTVRMSWNGRLEK